MHIKVASIRSRIGGNMEECEAIEIMKGGGINNNSKIID